MYEAHGLASPPPGRREAPVRLRRRRRPGVLVNPVISESSGEWAYEEGCLSVPGPSWEIIRPKARSTSPVRPSTARGVVRGGRACPALPARVDHLDAGAPASSTSTRISAGGKEGAARAGNGLTPPSLGVGPPSGGLRLPESPPDQRLHDAAADPADPRRLVYLGTPASPSPLHRAGGRRSGRRPRGHPARQSAGVGAAPPASAGQAAALPSSLPSEAMST